MTTLQLTSINVGTISKLLGEHGLTHQFSRFVSDHFIPVTTDIFVLCLQETRHSTEQLDTLAQILDSVNLKLIRATTPRPDLKDYGTCMFISKHAKTVSHITLPRTVGCDIIHPEHPQRITLLTTYLPYKVQTKVDAEHFLRHASEKHIAGNTVIIIGDLNTPIVKKGTSITQQNRPWSSFMHTAGLERVIPQTPTSTSKKGSGSATTHQTLNSLAISLSTIRDIDISDHHVPIQASLSLGQTPARALPERPKITQRIPTEHLAALVKSATTYKELLTL